MSPRTRELPAQILLGLLLLLAALGDSLLPLLTRLLGSLALLSVVLLPMALLTGVLIAARVVATRRLLRSRTRLVVLAPDSFDPSIESVLRCAAQLSVCDGSLAVGFTRARARFASSSMASTTQA